ncbi:MAG: DUF2961 domain-containing protein, partial [Planctomycetota bacterium]
YLVENYDRLGMLEGDDVIYSDGQAVQLGTGLEDAYNGGAYYNWVAAIPTEPEGSSPQSATRPLGGILYVNKAATTRADQYRWRIADCVPFTESIEVNIERRYGFGDSQWKSVGFWYQLPHLLQDLDQDGFVNFIDYSKFAQFWNRSDCNTCGFADFTGDHRVNYKDLRQLANSWLSQIQ